MQKISKNVEAAWSDKDILSELVKWSLTKLFYCALSATRTVAFNGQQNNERHEEVKCINMHTST